MKSAMVALLLFLPTVAPKRTVFIVDKVTTVAEAHDKLGGVGASSGENHLAPTVIIAFAKKCPSIAFTQNKADAEFILDPQQSGTILTNQKGEVLYASPAFRLSNMVKDVCKYVSQH